LLEGTEIDLQQISELYRASRRIAQANSASEILIAATKAVQQTTFLSALYIQEETAFRLIENPDQTVYYTNQLPKILNISPLQAQSYLQNSPIVIRDIQQPTDAIHSELLAMPEKLGCQSAALLPIFLSGELDGLIIIGSRERGIITQTSIQPFASFTELISTALEKVSTQHSTRQRLDDLELINNFSSKISAETDLTQLYALIYEELKSVIGDIDFYIALYDSKTDIIEIPYLIERGNPLHIDPFLLGEGLTSIVVRTRQPLMLVENTEQRAKALGAKIVDQPAKSWMGIPLIAGGDVVGIISLQDIENEHRFTEDDLVLLTTLAAPIAGAIHSARLLEDSERRAIQLQTAAEIARDFSATLERSEILNSAINLVRDRYNFYHASVFIIDNTGEYAVVEESTGEAGRQMVLEKHKLAVGSRSIIGYVTANGEPLVLNDVSQEPTHRFNPLLPDTRAEAGIPIKIGEQILGALDVQSTAPNSISPDDVEILQILADQLAVAITNAKLFTESHEHLAQHRLIHRVTTVADSSSGIEDALSSAVQWLRVTLGDRVSILLFDPHRNILLLEASSGYDEETLGLQIQIGQGITGWVAEKREPLLVNDVLNDPRYITGNENVRSELAVPLTYREELIGVLNIESDELNAFDEHDQDILGTLAGSLSAIIVNARLFEETQRLAQRERIAADVSSRIWASTDVDTILQTAVQELGRALKVSQGAIRLRIPEEGDADGNPGNPQVDISK
jgi:GAF domain-containing protein